MVTTESFNFMCFHHSAWFLPPEILQSIRQILVFYKPLGLQYTFTAIKNVPLFVIKRVIWNSWKFVCFPMTENYYLHWMIMQHSWRFKGQAFWPSQSLSFWHVAVSFHKHLLIMIQLTVFRKSLAGSATHAIANSNTLRICRDSGFPIFIHTALSWKRFSADTFFVAIDTQDRGLLKLFNVTLSAVW